MKLIYSAGAESRSKAVRPKALLDNCLKVMRMLFGGPCELGITVGGRILGNAGARDGFREGHPFPHRGIVPSVQVGGSPPNTVGDPSLNPSLDTSLPWSLGCCLCSAPPRAPWWVPKEAAKVGQMPLLLGPNTTLSRTVGLFMAGISSIQNVCHPLHGCGVRHSPLWQAAVVGTHSSPCPRGR